MSEREGAVCLLLGEGRRRSSEATDEEENTGAEVCDRDRRFEELAVEVGPLAFGVACRMLGDRASAEDALQDAFIQAYRGLPSFRGESTLRTWFLRILVNCCKRHRRIWRAWVERTDQLPRLIQETAQDDLGDPALRERLRQAISALPHRQRVAFVLRYTQDLSIGEIAEVMGCAPGTVKATIHKAVTKLRFELDGER